MNRILLLFFLLSASRLSAQYLAVESPNDPLFVKLMALSDTSRKKIVDKIILTTNLQDTFDVTDKFGEVIPLPNEAKQSNLSGYNLRVNFKGYLYDFFKLHDTLILDAFGLNEVEKQAVLGFPASYIATAADSLNEPYYFTTGNLHREQHSCISTDGLVTSTTYTSTFAPKYKCKVTVTSATKDLNIYNVSRKDWSMFFKLPDPPEAKYVTKDVIKEFIKYQKQIGINGNELTLFLSENNYILVFDQNNVIRIQKITPTPNPEQNNCTVNLHAQ